MSGRLRFATLIIFIFTASPSSFGAQSEIIAQFSLPRETVRLMGKRSWDKLYERVIEKLPEEKFVPGRILFKLKESPNVYIWRFNTKIDMAQMLTHVKSLPDVEFCQPDYIYTLESSKAKEAAGMIQTQNIDGANRIQPDDPWYPRQAHLKIAGMDNLFEKYGPSLEKLPIKGLDPYIHILDSGGGCEHPDLNRANIILGKDYVDGDDDPCSSPNGMSPHGEFVAAIMCAIPNNNHGGAGICPPNTKLVIWRVFDKNGKASGSTIALALADIVTQSKGLGNEIVNMSFSGPREDPFQSFFIMTGSASQELFGKNITFIGASGNDGDQTPHYPASLNEVISVGANNFPLAETGEISRAGYSSYSKVDIVAPGGGLNQDNDQNGIADGILVEGREYDKDGKNPTPYGAYLFLGTSGTAPIVSGVAASLINMGIYGPAAIRRVLTETTSDIPPFGYDQETGWGMVRADVAIMSTDDALQTFGWFNQNSYVCSVISDKNNCEISIDYTIRSDGPDIYLYENLENSLKNLGSFGTQGSTVITARPGNKTWVLLLYYQDGSNIPQVLAATVVTGISSDSLPQ